MRYYVNNFLLFSIFGYIFETILFTVLKLHNESGFTYLPWTAFYGVGVVIVILSSKLFDKLNVDKKRKNILMFIYFFFVLSLLEFLGGFALEWLHGYSLWTYKIIPLHIGKYISIPTSLLWATFSLIYLNIIKKYSDKLISKIPYFLTIILSLLFFSDWLVTMIKLLKLKFS